MLVKRSLSGPAGLVRKALRSGTCRGRQVRRFAARLGLWALFLQILLPLGQGIPLPGGSADGLPRQLVICSANGGLRTVPLPGAAANQSTSSAQSACAVCLAYAAGGHLTLPPLALEPLPRLLTLVRIDHSAVDLTWQSASGLPQARAPPVLVG
jgi:hypothetical protein